MKFSVHQDTQLRLPINCYHLCVFSGNFSCKFGPSGLITRFTSALIKFFLFFSLIWKVIITGKSSKFWPIICSHGHWTTRVIKRAKLTVTRDIHLWWPSPKTHDTQTCCRAFRLWQLGFENSTSTCEVNALTGFATAAAILVQFILVAVVFLKHLKVYVYHWCYNHVLVNSFFISSLYYITIIVHCLLLSVFIWICVLLCVPRCVVVFSQKLFMQNVNVTIALTIFFSVCSFLFLARQTDAVIITLNQLFTYSEISTCFSSLFFYPQKIPKIVIFLAPLFVFSAESSMSPSKQF